MAKLPSRTALTGLADGDLLHTVDVSDTTADAGGTSKKITAINVATYTESKLSKSGSDTDLITGTAGTDGNLGSWNADGDLVDASVVAANVATAGSAFSTDNVLIKSDGTAKGVQATGIEVTDTDQFSGFLGNINNQSGTTYTLVASDSGKVIVIDNSSAITVTLPNNLSAGFTCSVIQQGAGQITFTAASGAFLNNRQSHSKTFGQHAGVSLTVTLNGSGTNAVYNMMGDTAA